jgi:hypothetical protein
MAPVADKTLTAKKAAENTIFFMMHSFVIKGNERTQTCNGLDDLRAGLLTLTDNCFVWFVTSPANFKALSNSKLVPPTQEIRLGQELLARVVTQELLSKKLAKRVKCHRIRRLAINSLAHASICVKPADTFRSAGQSATVKVAQKSLSLMGAKSPFLMTTDSKSWAQRRQAISRLRGA